MANWDIRQNLLLSGVRQWKVAEEMGISESMLSKMLRRELPRDKKEKIGLIIEKLTVKE